MSENDNHFCVQKSIESLSASAKRAMQGQRAALLRGARWQPGETITISFMAGDPGLQKRVRDVAMNWTAPDMANVRLDFRNQGPTAVRIDFVQGNGSWSYIGTVCRNIPSNEPTMNYGWLTPASPDDELKRVVLHEFGHALGLIHEHQNPKGGIKWNKDAVKKDLSGPPNNWDDATIENNIFKHYSRRSVLATNTDPLSIMMYPIPASWTNGTFSAGLNRDLSENDKKLIRQAYPH